MVPLWYCMSIFRIKFRLNTRIISYTGLTRDGTFLIEAGKIVRLPHRGAGTEAKRFQSLQRERCDLAS